MSTECAPILVSSLQSRPRSSSACLAVCALGGIWFWAYWPTLAQIAERWATNPMYSHGYLVPLFSGYLLWRRRELICGEVCEPGWWGMPCVGVGIALHLASAYFYFEWFGAVSILVVLAGMSIAWGGFKAWRWAWPAIGFLVFMLPLPYRVEVSLAYPLQRLATLASTYALQTLGFPAIAEGNVIIMESARPLGIVEGCNGLGMLVTFFAMTTAVAFILPRSFVAKAVIVASAIPIALFSNVFRITVTGILAETVGGELAETFFHGLFGWLMPPFALGVLWLEMWILGKLVVDAPAEDQSAPRLAGWIALPARCPVS